MCFNASLDYIVYHEADYVFFFIHESFKDNQLF